MRKILLSSASMMIWTCIMMLPLFTVAQSAISGKIIAAASSMPIPSASVIVKGTKTGVATSAEGTFYITAKVGDILVISGIGIKTKEYKITGSGNQLISVDEEAYFNYRGTGFPAFAQGGPGTGNSGKIPLRFQYPGIERTTNGENLTAALSSQFGESDDINLAMWVIK